MGALSALPALDVKAPEQPDLLSKYAQLQQLRGQQQQLQTQQQLAPLQIQQAQNTVQQQQQDLADKAALTKSLTQWDGKDYNDLYPLIIKNGGSGTAVLGLKKNVLDQQSTISTAAKNNAQAAEANVSATLKKNDAVTGALAPLQDPTKTPDDQLPQLLTQTVQSLVQQGLLDPPHAQAAAQLAQSGDPAAIRQGLSQFTNTLKAQSQIQDEALKQAQTKEAQYKIVNGTLMDISGNTPKPALANALNPQAWNQLVDSTVPLRGASDPNRALNQRTHSVVNFYVQQGNTDAAQKAITDAANQVGDIEKQTNPLVQQGKINVAAAEGQARANVDAQIARGSNAALAQVPPHLIGPATAAATKAGTDYAQAQSVSQTIAQIMQDAKNGNVVSYQLIPQEGALQITTSQGVKRINMAEIQNYGGGSAWQRLQGHIGGALTGQSIPASVLSDMSQIQDAVAKGSQAKYENELRTVNQTYGAKFEPVQMQPAGTPMNGQAQPGATPQAPTPQTHQFSVSAWQRANPKGDANAAKAAATAAGYQVTQ